MNIPSEIKTRFDVILVKKPIPAQYHNHYRKWLRYYLDFCQKYHHSDSEKESIPHFIKKLQDKHQTREQQKQASHAIPLYHTLIQSESKKQQTTEPAKKASGRYDLPTGQAGSIPRWNTACDNLKAEIKAKHY